MVDFAYELVAGRYSQRESGPRKLMTAHGGNETNETRNELMDDIAETVPGVDPSDYGAIQYLTRDDLAALKRWIVENGGEL